MRRRDRKRTVIKRVTVGLLGISLLPLTPVAVSQAAENGKKTPDKIVLRVANWEEYIDEGGWDEAIELEDENHSVILGENSIVEDFEQWYWATYGVQVEVEYSTYGNNEDLYNQLTLGNTMDLICPSEYMFMKLISEDRLQPLSENFFDTGEENNYYIRGVSGYIKNIFDENTIEGQPWSKFAAGYMWGTTGIVYNPQVISEEEASHWKLLKDPKYKGQVTIKDNVRDSYFAALGILNEEELLQDKLVKSAQRQQMMAKIMNRTDDQTVEAAEDTLKEIKKNAYSFESDSGKSDMVTGKVLANYQWSGDAVYTMDQADVDDYTLCYAVPEECTNIWFDGWVMLKDGIKGDPEKQQAAEAFINFISRPDNVVRNMDYIGYTSVIAGGDSDLIFSYADWCYGTEEEEGTVEYPVGFFFSGDNSDQDYIITADAQQTNRQLYAQYPPQDVLERTVVMQYFDRENNDKINQMWVNVRCFDLTSLTFADWGKIIFVAVAVIVGLVIFHRRDDVFRKRR